MNESKIFNELLAANPSLNSVRENIWQAFLVLDTAVKSGKTIYVCGNGGSAADSEHIVGELMKRFRKDRPLNKEFAHSLSAYGKEGEFLKEKLEGGIKCVALTSHISLTTAIANDTNPQLIFAQQLSVLGEAGDVLIAISTSGNSKSCVYAAVVANAKGMNVISLTGEKESALSACSFVTVNVPETETYKVQELHLPVYHALCAMLEEANF